jgi:hypothetical protein
MAWRRSEDRETLTDFGVRAILLKGTWGTSESQISTRECFQNLIVILSAAKNPAAGAKPL